MDRPELHTTNTQEGTRNKEKLRNRSFAALSAIGVAAVLAACGPNAEATQNTPPAPEVTTGTEAPTPVETTETEPAPTDVERLSADLSYLELAQASVDLTTEWQFDGATEDTIEETYDRAMELADEKTSNNEGFDMVAIYRDIAVENAEEHTPSLFPDDWQSIEGAVEYREKLIDMNAEAIEVNMLRHTNGEPLVTWTRELVPEESKEIEDPATVPENERMISFVTLVTPQNSDTTPFKRLTVQSFDISTGDALVVGEATNNL